MTYRFRVPNSSSCGLVTSLGRGLGAAATLAGRWSRLVEGETARRTHNGDGEAAAASRRRPRRGWLDRVRRRFSRSSELLVFVYWEEFVRKRFPGNNCKRMTSFSLPQKRDFVTVVKTLCNLLRCQCCENNIARVYLSTL